MLHLVLLVLLSFATDILREYDPAMLAMFIVYGVVRVHIIQLFGSGATQFVTPLTQLLR